MIEFTQKNIIDVCLGTKTIQAGYFGTTLVYQKSSPGPSTDPYITLKANEPSTIGLASKSSVHTLEYSTDKTNWNTMDTSTSINLSDGDKVYVRGILSAAQDVSYTRFSITGNVKVSGNINAVWNYQDLTASLKDYCGYRLFYGCTGLYDISDLQLPATILAQSCYRAMFYGCTELTSIPTNLLPATTLVSGCYSNMFYGCTSLTTVPTNLLHATTLAQSCYGAMFCGCTSLTVAPELPAITLTEYCYDSMFRDCSSLTTAPTEIAATTLASECCRWMFRSCISLTTAPRLSYTGELVSGCYEEMFRECSNLNYVYCKGVPNSSVVCTSGWLSGVSSTGTFVVKDYSTIDKWSRGYSGIPQNWTIRI